jgi:glycosyltransferase involved in cell wall biosynthesis
MKIFYWAPILSNIATLKAVVNSAESLMSYSDKYNVTLINVAGEFNKFKKENIKSNIYDLNKDLVNKDLPGVGYIKTRLSMMYIFFKSFFLLKKYLEKEKPDFIIIHLLTSLPLILYLLFNFETKCILRISGFPKMNFFRLALWRLCSNRIYKITCPTDLTNNYLKKYKFINPNRIVTLYDPIINVKKITELKKEFLDLKNKKFYFSAGRLTYQKNFNFLIDSFINLNQENDDKIPLLIAGDGEEKIRLEKKVKAQKNNLVNLIGYKDNIYKFMKNSNAFILASNWEDPGFVLIEAAFCRTFIISSNCKNGPLEFIDRDGGLLFENNNIEDFKDKIKKFINLSETEKKKFKLEALKKSKNFTIFRHFINLNKILNYS